MEANTTSIIKEELLRSIVWAGLGLAGWGLLISNSSMLEATVLNVLGLPVLTWAVLTIGMIGARLVTGMDLQVQSMEGLSVGVILGILASGFAALYFIVVEGYSPLLVGGSYIAITIATILWVRYVVFSDIESRSST